MTESLSPDMITSPATIDSSPLPPSTFSISPKTAHEWLVEQKRPGFDYAAQLKEDIIKNAMEIEKGVNWGDVISSISWIRQGKRHEGGAAIQQSVATTVGAIARVMGWNMHTPEVVYMSSYCIIHPLTTRIDALNKDIAAIENGTHRFPTDDAKTQKLTAEKQEAGKLGAFRKKLKDSTKAYADTSLPQDDTYRAVLRMLIRTGHDSTRTIRDKALRRLKNGNASEALEILQKQPLRRIYKF